jgi:hypothetical protein
LTDTNFNLGDFLDPGIKDEVCLVCSLPLPERKKLEQEVFDNPDRHAVAKAFGIEASDLTHHYHTCIIERDSGIPKGQLLGQLLNQLSAFVTELENFRVFVNGERNPDSLRTYAMMFKELRQTIESLNKQQSPEYEASRIKNLILRPLIYTMVKSKIDKLGELRTLVTAYVPDDKQSLIDAAFTDCAKSWGQLATNQSKQTILKLAEIQGVDPSNL